MLYTLIAMMTRKCGNNTGNVESYFHNLEILQYPPGSAGSLIFPKMIVKIITITIVVALPLAVRTCFQFKFGLRNLNANSRAINQIVIFKFKIFQFLLKKVKFTYDYKKIRNQIYDFQNSFYYNIFRLYIDWQFQIKSNRYAFKCDKFYLMKKTLNQNPIL